jgi:hypothetical protein
MRLRATSYAIETGSMAGRYTPIARHGHLGQAYRTSLALAWPGLAERLRRKADRIDPA